MQLKKRLKTKWALKGEFSLIDIGYDSYITRFTSREACEHIHMDRPWMIGDNHLVTQEWILNFILEENKITKLMAWVRIPKLGVEYFNKHFLLKKIGGKLARCLRSRVQ